MITTIHQFFGGAKISLALYIADLNPWIFLGVHIPRALLQAAFFILMAKAAGGDGQARFALIGNALHVAAMTAIIYMASAIESEKWEGTLIFRIASPSNWLASLLGRSVAEYAHSLFSALLILIIFVPFFAPEVSWLNLLRAAPLFFLALVSASAIGWLIGSIALPVRWGTMIGNVVAYSMMILCGINFPITALAPQLQVLSKLLPLTHGLMAARAVIEGGSYGSVLPLAGMELLVALVYSAIAWLVFGYRLRIIRQTGNFELV